MRFEREAIAPIHPEVFPAFTQEGGPVIARMMQNPSVWSTPRIDIDMYVPDEGTLYHIQRGGIDKIPYNYVLCHLFIDREDGPATRAYQISVGRKQPIFSIRDSRMCEVVLDKGWTVRYTAMFDEEHGQDAHALPDRTSAVEFSHGPTFYSAYLTHGEEDKFDIFSDKGNVRVMTLSDTKAPSRPATAAEIAVFHIGYSFVGYRDESVRDVAMRGADGTNWPQWKNPFGE